MRIVEERADAWIVEAGAGESWHDFVAFTLEQGCPGLENLALIPGTVGAAPVQNIGAYGVELKERFESLDAVDLVTGRSVTLGPRDLRLRLPRQRLQAFARRPQPDHARALPPAAAVAAGARLPRAAEKDGETGIDSPDARQIFDWVVAIRRAKLPDPAAIGNAGSFFKNPVVTPEQCRDIIGRDPEIVHYPMPDGSVKLAAAWMIDACGWKGKSVGQAGVYEKPGARPRQPRRRDRLGGDDAVARDPGKRLRALRHPARARAGGRLKAAAAAARWPRTRQARHLARGARLVRLDRRGDLDRAAVSRRLARHAVLHPGVVGAAGGLGRLAPAHGDPRGLAAACCPSASFARSSRRSRPGTPISSSAAFASSSWPARAATASTSRCRRRSSTPTGTPSSSTRAATPSGAIARSGASCTTSRPSASAATPRRNDGLRRAWFFACKEEAINPRQPSRLPLLFALDDKFGVPGGVVYSPAPRPKLARGRTAAVGHQLRRRLHRRVVLRRRRRLGGSRRRRRRRRRRLRRRLRAAASLALGSRPSIAAATTPARPLSRPALA